MQWSQLKKRVESLFSDAVRGRVELHTTRYHKAPDQWGRSWITIDGREIMNMCSFAAEAALWQEAKLLQEALGCADYTDPSQLQGYHRAVNEANAMLREKAIVSRSEFNQLLFQYLNLSIDQIMTSPDPIIRAIGMLDRRLGKRRLGALDISNEHELIQRLFQFRCEAEDSSCGTGGQP